MYILFIGIAFAKVSKVVNFVNLHSGLHAKTYVNYRFTYKKQDIYILQIETTINKQLVTKIIFIDRAKKLASN